MKPPFPCFTETWRNTSYDAISPTRHELSVANKTVIVTGGGRGIGAESAKAFAAAGASHVVLIGRTQSFLSETAESIQKEFASVSVSTYAADVADEAAMGKAAEKFKNWDALILNAGTLLEPQPVEKTEVTDWWCVFETNVKGAMVTTRAFLPFRNTDASIVGVNAYIITLPASNPIAMGSSAYSCSKFAQAKLLEYVAAEHPDLFTVSVHPGCVDTELFRTAGLGAKVDPGVFDDVSLSAHFLLWLVSKEARFLNGKFVCANWDVEEMKAKAEVIESSRVLGVNLHGWPFGGAMDAMLAQADSER